MYSTSLSKKTNYSTSAVLTWRAGVDSPSQQASLETICFWWSELAGKHVTWKIVIGPGISNILTYDCCIEKTALRFDVLYYYIEGSEAHHSVPVKQLYLDLEFQELTIVVDSVSDVKYRVRPLPL